MANPNPSPRYGSDTVGKRSSKLFTNTAVPPTGKPDEGSRGPACFNPNPRCELPPPAKNCSGKGIVAKVHVGSPAAFNGHDPGGKMRVPPKGCSIPMLVERANT